MKDLIQEFATCVNNCNFNDFFKELLIGGIVMGIYSIPGIILNIAMKDFDKEQSLDALKLIFLAFSAVILVWEMICPSDPGNIFNLLTLSILMLTEADFATKNIKASMGPVLYNISFICSITYTILAFVGRYIDEISSLTSIAFCLSFGIFAIHFIFERIVYKLPHK